MRIEEDGRLFYFLAVEEEVGKCDVVVEAGEGVGAGGYAVEGGVFNLNVVDVAEVFEAFDLDAEFTFFACHVFEIDVLDCRGEAAVADLALFVYEIDFEDGFLALAYLYVAYEDVFNDAAAT